MVLRKGEFQATMMQVRAGEACSRGARGEDYPFSGCNSKAQPCNAASRNSLSVSRVASTTMMTRLLDDRVAEVEMVVLVSAVILVMVVVELWQ
jgi:hypothetical protein